jgi:hypothetical protein
MLSTDPFFANNNMMMICDSDEEVPESPADISSAKANLSDSTNCIG